MRNGRVWMRTCSFSAVRHEWSFWCPLCRADCCHCFTRCTGVTAPKQDSAHSLRGKLSTSPLLRRCGCFLPV